MPKRFLANIMTDAPTAPDGNFISSAASGVWSLAEALSYTKGGLWPTTGNTFSRAFWHGGATSGDNKRNDIQTVVSQYSRNNDGTDIDFYYIGFLIKKKKKKKYNFSALPGM